MSRLDDYRQLQSSVPGLDGLYQSIGDAIASQSQSGDRILIVGGGGGREIELLAERGISADLTIVDPSPENLRHAEEMAIRKGYLGGVEFVEGTVETLPRSCTFDTITCVFVLHTMDEPTLEKQLLKEVEARLKPSGNLILADMCFGDAPTIDDLIETYVKYARPLGTKQSLIDLEIQSVLARRHRSEACLREKLSSARLAYADEIGTAQWYAAFTVVRSC